MSAAKLILIGIVCLSACQGNREPPLAAGDGLLLEGGGVSRTLRVDPKRVPLLSECSAGQVVVSNGGENWSCADGAPLAGASLAVELENLRQAARMLESDVAFLEQRADDLSADLQQLNEQLAQKATDDARLAYGFPASACAPASTEVLARMSQTSGDGIDFRGGAIGAITLYCPVIATSPGVAWNDLSIRYRDTDGNAPAGEVRGALRYLDPRGAITDVASVSSNSNPSTEQAEVTTAFTHTFDFEQRHYFVELTISRANTTPVPEIYGFQLTRR